MKNRNLLMQVRACTSNLFFNGFRWSMLVIAYALVALLIVMSSETYFSEGVYAAEIAYATEAYDFSEPKDVFCMSIIEPEEESNQEEQPYSQQLGSLSNKAVQENHAIAVATMMSLDVQQQVNVNIVDSVVNDKTEKKSVKKVATTKSKSQVEEAKEAFQKSNTSSTKIKLSSTEKSVLLRIVEAEATGEDVKGKMLVANVVLNRVKNSKFPDTIEKVVFQKNGSVYQFSPIKDGRYYKVSISADTKKAVERVLNGEDESKGALYFMSRSRAKSSNVTWFDRALTRVLKHGTHEFYK